ncbi:MAG: YggS family pyridoxal phosphate-dependent enzyme [Rhodospirillaceae bacterium]|jgi:pyridoxal phosphate enzyme (YggS family)|nr:YggS family pyridoxal phosphate-dependent enzyme [Rhodospirillaceae bacterium]
MIDCYDDVLNKFYTISTKLADAEVKAGRPTGKVHLVVVSKNHHIACIRPLLEVGHRMFGENRIQEARNKWSALKHSFSDIELHLIGPLQTNKIKEAVEIFDVIETIDRPKVAIALAKEMKNCCRRLRCFIQVNIGVEMQKSGVLPEIADVFIEDCRHRLQLPIEGLMCIPPHGVNPMPYFIRLADMARRHDLSQLSMGMSEDYSCAVLSGATYVRIGTAIFGNHKIKPESNIT